MKTFTTTMVLLLTMTLVIFFTSFASAGWHVNKTTDKMTDEVTKASTILNDKGDFFSIDGVEGGESSGMLCLKSRATFGATDSFLIRIDKNTPARIANKFAVLGVGSMLYFTIYEAGKCDLLCQILKGKKMVIRWSPKYGTGKDIVFDISKNKKCIRETLGLKKTQCN